MNGRPLAAFSTCTESTPGFSPEGIAAPAFDPPVPFILEDQREPVGQAAGGGVGAELRDQGPGPLGREISVVVTRPSRRLSRKAWRDDILWLGQGIPIAR